MSKTGVWIFSHVIFACFIMMSCSMNIGKQTPLQELENLTEDIRIHHAEYSTADWKEVYARYEQISAEMENYQYSTDEAEKIGKLEGECMGYFMKSCVKSLDGLGSEIKGFFDGLNEAIEESDK